MTTTIAVLDADQLRDLIRSEIHAALDGARGMLEAAAAELAAARKRQDPLKGGLMTAKTVSEVTGIAPRELRRLVHEGGFPAPLHAGARRIRWRMQDIVEWMERAHQSAEARRRFP